MDLSNAVLVHFYRAVVSHADVWRQRMDATTNWAAATTAAMVTFSFGDRAAPHVVLLLTLGFNMIFLLMESRRYQVYDLWRRRFRTLNQYMIAPVLSPLHGPDAAAIQENLARVAADLGRTVPHLSLLDATGYRLQRNYVYLIGVALVAWVTRLAFQPHVSANLDDVIERAAIGSVPGSVVMASVALFALACIILAARAPSEHMLNWMTIPSPAERLVAQSRRWIGKPGRPS
ncbi:MAG TPA: DUF2270 domain-containing protein [Gemmatimonadaceae bacterium]|nr:DUF2270 domain-containing protein [Gemmatimonadaceae bacterium]